MAAITRTTAKELVPLVDRPAIDWVVGEAIHAGLEQICIITSQRKLPMLEAHFAEAQAEIAFVEQVNPLGLGHAVLTAREWAQDQDVAVLLPDDLVLGDPILARLLELTEASGTSTLALTEVPVEIVGQYGVAKLRAGVSGDGLAIESLVEKPAKGTEPSRFSITGRYVLTSAIWPALASVGIGRNGEIQLTDALGLLAANGSLYGLPTRGERHDLGNPQSWLRANVSYASHVYGTQWLDEIPALRDWSDNRNGRPAHKKLDS